MKTFRAALFASAMLAAHGAAMATAAPHDDLFAGPASAIMTTQLDNLPASTMMRVVFSLPLRDQAGAEAFAHAVSDSHSPDFGKYLTPTQWGERFGGSRADYDAVVAWASNHGLEIGERRAGRTTVTVRGSVDQLQTLFATRIAAFRTAAGDIGFAPVVAPTLPADLSGHVNGVIGLASAKRFATFAIKAPAGVPHQRSAGGTGVAGAYAPADFRKAYDVLPQLGKSRSEIVAVFEQGGFHANDISRFRSQYALPYTPVIVRNVDGYDGSVNNKDVELEAALDIETAIGINPVLKNVMVYEDGNDPFNVALLDSLTAIAQDDAAQTVSISYGLPEDQQGAAAMTSENQVLLQLVAQGQSVFVSSGDNGAYEYSIGNQLAVNDPASQPLVTSVGGTTLLTAPNGDYGSELAWNELSHNLGATGGGISTQWKIPDYQVLNGVSVALTNRGSANFRNVPDVAADADPLTGASVYSKINGGWLQVGGTSLAAPIVAGMSSLTDAARVGAGLPHLGQFNTEFYSLLNSASGDKYGQNDVTAGSNTDLVDHPSAGFDAGPFYDNVTGFGSLDAFHTLIKFFIHPSDDTAPGAATNVAAKVNGSNVTVTWSPGQGAAGYFLEIGPQPTFVPASYKVTITTQARFTGLIPSKTYQAVVYSVAPDGASSTSEVIKFTTPAATN